MLGLVVLLVVRATADGFPGIADGDVPLWSVRLDGHLPEAFSVLGARGRARRPWGRERSARGLPASPLQPWMSWSRPSVLARWALPHPPFCQHATPPGPNPPPTRPSLPAYAFYMQPMMMALLPEMPQGPDGVAAMSRAVRTTLYGGALSIYAATGLFGAALFGADTQGCARAGVDSVWGRGRLGSR